MRTRVPCELVELVASCYFSIRMCSPLYVRILGTELTGRCHQHCHAKITLPPMPGAWMGLHRLTHGSVLRVIMSLLGASGLPCLAIIRAQQIYYHKLSDGHCSVAALVAKLLGKGCSLSISSTPIISWLVKEGSYCPQCTIAQCGT